MSKHEHQFIHHLREAGICLEKHAPQKWMPEKWERKSPEYGRALFLWSLRPQDFGTRQWWMISVITLMCTLLASWLIGLGESSWWALIIPLPLGGGWLWTCVLHKRQENWRRDYAVAIWRARHPQPGKK